jgi:hypothetical protein
MTENGAEAQYFDTTPTEFARILKILAGKGGAGKPTFPSIALHAANGSGISADHMSKMETASLAAEWYAPAMGGAAFDFAIDDPSKVLDYLGRFPSDAGVRISFDPTRKRLVLGSGTKTTSMGTVPVESVPRPKGTNGADPYSPFPDGFLVNTNPANVPKKAEDAANIEAWAKAGYSIVRIPLASLADVIEDAALLYSHEFRKTLIDLTVLPEGTLRAEVQDPTDPDADRFVTGSVPGAKVVSGTPNEDKIRIHYGATESILRSLGFLKAEYVTLVHFAGNGVVPPEKRVTILGSEVDKDGQTTLRVSISFMSWRKGGKATEPA